MEILKYKNLGGLPNFIVYTLRQGGLLAPLPVVIMVTIESPKVGVANVGVHLEDPTPLEVGWMAKLPRWLIQVTMCNDEGISRRH